MNTVVLDVKEGILSLPFYKGNQARARRNCAELLALLRSDCSNGRMPERVEGSEPLGYLNELSEMKFALLRNDWCGACDALVDLFHFRAAAIDPVRSILVRLLERLICRRTTRMKWLNVRKSLFERQYRRKLKSNYFMSQVAEYEGTLSRIQHWLQYADETLDARARLELLDFLMEAILEDIRSSAACELVYAPRYKTRDWRGVLDFGYRLGAKCGGMEQISSEGKTVVSSPYDWEKTFLALRSILTRGFHSDLGDYNGIYYPELNLISVTNGMHHSWVASQKCQHGVYRVSVYRLADMFPRFFTDGEFWYDHSKPNAKYPVYDVRIALLYELAKIKNASCEGESR